MRALLAAAVLFATAAVASGHVSGHNYVVNFDAESGNVDGWIESGWKSLAYGHQLRQNPNNETYDRAFAATSLAATLVQTVSVADIAAQIDAGQPTDLSFSAYVGGGPGEGGAMATLQPLDDAGRDLGSFTRFGPPSAQDYDGEQGLLECFRAITLPPGTRSVRITLMAVGDVSPAAPALADNIRFGGPFASTQVGFDAEPSSAADCQRFPTPGPTPTVTASPTPTPTVSTGPPPPPGASRVALSRRRVSFLAAVTGRFHVLVERRGLGGWVRKRHASVRLEAGTKAITTFKRLPDGRYRVTVSSPRDAIVAKFRLR